MSPNTKPKPTPRRPDRACVGVPLHKRLCSWAVVAAMGLCVGGCIEDLAQSIVDRTVSKHLDGIADDGGTDKSEKPRGAGGGFKIANRFEPSAKIVATSQTDACRADLAAGLEKIKEDQGLSIAVGKAQVDAVVAEGKVTIPYARDGVRHRPGFGLFKTEGACELRFYRRETIEPGHSESATSNYGSASLAKCVCE